MTVNKGTLLLPFFLVIFIAGCAQNDAGASQLDYDQTKKMVVDILKTDDGKKAIQEIMSDDQLKKELVMDQQVVSETIQKTLTSDEGAQFWKKSFEDPAFAESMAKSMEKQHEALLKRLMKDPEYRGMMVEVMKDPELHKEVEDLMKSNEYRKHIQKVMTETFESPLFQAKIQDLIIKAAGEVQSGKQEDQGGDESGSGESQGQEQGES
jgi:spore germination protein D